MRDVKAYYDGQLMVRAAAVERDIAREPVDDWRTFINLYKDEDRRNQTRIDEQHTSHFMEGASWNNEYHIPGAGAPFERLFFQARDALNEVAENLAYERKDRDYERACHVEWEDFDCIEALIYTEQDLSQARRELEHTQDEISVLRMEVQELKESLSVCRSSSAAAPPLHPPLSPTPPTLLPFTGTAGAAGPVVRVAAGAAGPARPGVGERDKNTF